MRSRTIGLVLVASWTCMSCGGSDESLDSATPADTADDNGPTTDDDAALPAFNDADDDGAVGDDTGGAGGDDTATGDDVPDDDVAPAPTVEPGDDVPADDDIAASDDDLAADDDLPASDDDVPAPVPAGLGSVGSACETDGDCSSGLECLDDTKTYFGGVYPNGLCTAACNVDPFVCDTLGAGCLGDDVEAWCVPACQLGSAGIKCRADQTCVASDPENYIGYCDSMCRDDLDCPEGLQCEATTGFCVDMPYEGTALGEACTAAEDCAGRLCLTPGADATDGMCTQTCNLQDGLAPCGVAQDDTGPAPGACDPITSTLVFNAPLGPGDMGLCTSTCDLDTGCLPGWTCAELVPEAQAIVGHEGLCLFSDLLVPETMDAGVPAPVDPPEEMDAQAP